MIELRRFAKIETHENVTIEYETAGIGSRLVAFFVDTVLLGLLFVVVTLILYLASVSIPLIESSPLTFAAIAITVWFVAKYFYYIIFERLMKGSTPGKKLMHLRVVSATGEAETLMMSVVRNFFRVADVLPAGYLVGALFAFFDERNRRLGDRVANTMVIRVIEGKNLRKFTNKIDALLEEAEAESKKEQEDIEAGNIPDKWISEKPDVPPLQEKNEFLTEYFKKKKAYYSTDLDKTEIALLKDYLNKFSELTGITKFVIAKPIISDTLKKLAETDGTTAAAANVLFDMKIITEKPAETEDNE